MASDYKALSQQQMQYDEILKASHTVGSERGETSESCHFLSHITPTVSISIFNNVE